LQALVVFYLVFFKNISSVFNNYFNPLRSQMNPSAMM